MKILVLVSRLLLGLIFTIFGLNGFLQFMNMPQPQGLAGQYMTVLYTSHYLAAVCALETIGGLLLLVNRYVPLALTVLAPIIFNIVLYHALMAPQAGGAAVVAVALWAVLFYRERPAFAGLFSRKGVS